MHLHSHVIEAILPHAFWHFPTHLKIGAACPHLQSLGDCDFFLNFHARHALNSACEKKHSFPAEQRVVLPQRVAIFLSAS